MNKTANNQVSPPPLKPLHGSSASVSKTRSTDNNKYLTRIDILLNNHIEHNAILSKNENSILCQIKGKKISFTHGYLYKQSIILASINNDFAKIDATYEEILPIKNVVAPLGQLLKSSNNELIAVVVDIDNQSIPLFLRLSKEVCYAGEHVIPLLEAEVSVSLAKSRVLSTMVIQWQENSKVESIRVIAPTMLINDIWREMALSKLELELPIEGIVALYKKYNLVKRNNFLNAIYSDIIIFNKALESGIGMSDLTNKLNATEPIVFAEDKQLREATIEKVMLLSVILPQIKRKLELLTSMYPYLWLQQESNFIKSILGQQCQGTVIAGERKRLIPLIRQGLRLTQGNIQRSLSEIEMGIRPLEAVLAKDEIQKHWSSKTRRFVPALVQGGLAVGLIASGTGGLMGTRLLVGVIGTQALGGLFGAFQQDKEAAAHVKRVAGTIFPWWEVFMKTLVVAIYESGNFINEENARAEKRDYQLLNSLDHDDKTNALKKLPKLLRKLLLEAEGKRFLEVASGSELTNNEILNDIENATNQEMRHNVDDFINAFMLPSLKA